jgi:hypothetical protein
MEIEPKYPIYIISKGRWESRLTAKTLERMQVPYLIAVEPQEFDQYAAVIDPKKIIVTPFSNLGQASIPVRNFVWEHAKASGAKRHWLLDDNINGFYRMVNNEKILVMTGAIFRAFEDLVDRYSNVPFAGFNYFMFGCPITDQPPLTVNTRIYSCTLIENSLEHRWRGKYNEDTDLSLRILKDGHCTLLCNAFLAGKAPTLTMKGGNTDEIYKHTNQRMEFAESLREQHPDVVEVTWKFGRWHHQVDYSQFRGNRLKLVNPDAPKVPQSEYGMKVVSKAWPKWMSEDSHFAGAVEDIPETPGSDSILNP